ncbi:MAG: TetR/AcrR family transcriptional regulator [Myxococcales bacterium]|nr:TetR/AcrR family transcriptional regulator [Myxococcales bacterium]
MEQLIRLARRDFSRHGYVDRSVERIAAEANLTKGAAYYHFGSKEGLFEAVLRGVQRDLVRRPERSSLGRGASGLRGVPRAGHRR